VKMALLGGLAWRAIQWNVAKTVEEQCVAAACSCIVQSQYAEGRCRDALYVDTNEQH
jgi:hypothetical protein